MEWTERLQILLKDSNLSAVARSCGWETYRVSQMLGRGSLPNVEDAITLCRYIPIGVEDIWGPDAVDDEVELLARKAELMKKRKAATPRAAADQALAEALDRVAEKDGERRGSKSDRDTGRKSA